MSAGPDLTPLIDRLSRRETGRLVGALTRVLGASALSLAEDCVQDAFVAALTTWCERGVPDNPFAWLLTTARNRAVDRLRRHAMMSALEPKVGEWLEQLNRPTEDVLGDEELSLMVLCCDPALDADARLALTLKTVCGFRVEEIARAFLATPEAIAQRLVRAKARVRALGLEFAMPAGAGLAERMPSVSRTIYLLFNEGYSASDGDRLIRDDFCAEALRLAEVVAWHPRASSPEAHALAALVLFQHARRTARVAADGTPLMLEEQERRLWDQAMIARGFQHLAASQNDVQLTALHLEAGIASVHAAATSWARTDWAALVSYYDALQAIAPSAVVAINRAIAIGMLRGPEAGLRALAPVTGDKAVARYLPYHLAIGDLELRRDDKRAARAAFARALELPMSLQERKLIEAKLKRADHG
ncbi:MAG: sigma-70 family RNA polymerase sigma factor [Alphaproteobacteria bacterium]|nr:sigma-70 family RNA polymerase sigma factor [Alphaproteobacteria bacterium]